MIKPRPFAEVSSVSPAYKHTTVQWHFDQLNFYYSNHRTLEESNVISLVERSVDCQNFVVHIHCIT